MKPILNDTSPRAVALGFGAIASHGIHSMPRKKRLRMLVVRWIKPRMPVLNWRDCWRPKVLPMKFRCRIFRRKKRRKLMGLNMQQINAEKQDFIKTVIPQWEDQARKKRSVKPQPHGCDKFAGRDSASALSAHRSLVGLKAARHQALCNGVNMSVLRSLVNCRGAGVRPTLEPEWNYCHANAAGV